MARLSTSVGWSFAYFPHSVLEVIPLSMDDFMEFGNQMDCHIHSVKTNFKVKV